MPAGFDIFNITDPPGALLRVHQAINVNTYTPNFEYFSSILPALQKARPTAYPGIQSWSASYEPVCRDRSACVRANCWNPPGSNFYTLNVTSYVVTAAATFTDSALTIKPGGYVYALEETLVVTNHMADPACIAAQGGRGRGKLCARCCFSWCKCSSHPHA